VTHVRCFDRLEYMEKSTPRVDIWHGSSCSSIWFDSLSAATAYADDLVAKVNEAKSVAEALVKGREE